MLAAAVCGEGRRGGCDGDGVRCMMLVEVRCSGGGGSGGAAVLPRLNFIAGDQPVRISHALLTVATSGVVLAALSFWAGAAGESRKREGLTIFLGHKAYGAATSIARELGGLAAMFARLAFGSVVGRVWSSAAGTDVGRAASTSAGGAAAPPSASHLRADPLAPPSRLPESSRKPLVNLPTRSHA